MFKRRNGAPRVLTGYAHQPIIGLTRAAGTSRPDQREDRRPPGEWARGPDAAPRVRGWRAPDADAARRAWSRSGDVEGVRS